MFVHAVTCMRDYNTPILPLSSYDVFVIKAKETFPRLWKHLSALRNVSGNRNEVYQDRLLPRERQVFSQILALRRMRNFRELKWWAMIQTVAYYGWGVGRTALDATTFWGMTCSSATRVRCMVALTNNITEKRVKYLTKEEAVLFCIDNYQEQLNTKHMRAKHSSGTMDGTNEIVHRVRPYTDSSFDGQHVEVTYTADQAQPSPVHMRHYEQLKHLSGAQFFETHSEQPPGTEPDMVGSRCAEYHTRKTIARWINHVNRVFNCADEEVPDFPTKLECRAYSKVCFCMQRRGCVQTVSVYN